MSFCVCFKARSLRLVMPEKVGKDWVASDPPSPSSTMKRKWAFVGTWGKKPFLEIIYLPYFLKECFKTILFYSQYTQLQILHIQELNRPLVVVVDY